MIEHDPDSKVLMWFVFFFQHVFEDGMVWC